MRFKYGSEKGVYLVTNRNEKQPNLLLEYLRKYFLIQLHLALFTDCHRDIYAHKTIHQHNHLVVDLKPTLKFREDLKGHLS